MKRKMILKRITSFVCAMMVLIGAVGGAVPYFANVNLTSISLTEINSHREYYSIKVDELPFDSEERLWYMVYQSSPARGLLIVFPSEYEWTINHISYNVGGSLRHYYKMYSSLPDGTETYWYTPSMGFYQNDDSLLATDLCEYRESDNVWKYGYKLVASNFDVGIDGVMLFEATHPRQDVPDIPDEPLGSVGFLWGINHEITYARGKYYNYNEDSRTDRWTFDKILTSGEDVSLGGYTVKHYVRPVLVNGYDDEDVIEKYQKFYDDTYDADNCYIQYLNKDLQEKLYEQGYDDVSWFDKYILGRFILRWHYFELIDNETGRSDGYVRVRQKDADSINGGTEYLIEAVDEYDNLIDGYEAHVGYIGEGTYVKSEGEDIEDAFDDAEDDIEEQEDHTNIVNLDGVSIFASVMESFADSTANFSAVIGNFFNCLPPWVLTVFGLSVALTFLAFIIKNLR